jgi:L-amino acid N-acyltransferase YncA
MHVAVRQATDADLPGILDIVNDAILNSTAIWSHYAYTLESRRAWLAERREKNYPVLVALIGQDVAGFSSFGDFRPHDGYLHSVEHSVYVHRHHHGKGIGKQLMGPLFEAAKHLGKHVMIGGVEAGNAASLTFHRNLGFVETGRLKEVGFKFDRWLDLVFVQKTLDAAHHVALD